MRLSGSLPSLWVESGNASSLQLLDVGNNNLAGGDVRALSKLSSVRRIDVSGNRVDWDIADVVDSIIGMKNLSLFRADSNRISGNASEMWPWYRGISTQNKQLVSLSLSNNFISGQLSSKVFDSIYKGAFTFLQILNMDNNNL
jgi:hypothetical protein